MEVMKVVGEIVCEVWVRADFVLVQGKSVGYECFAGSVFEVLV